MSNKNQITPRVERFCHEYLIDLNGKQAAIRSGYSPKAAAQQASLLLSKPQVAAFLSLLMKQRNSDLTVTADRVLKELARLAFHDVGSYYKIAGGKEVLKTLDELTEDQRHAIVEYDPKAGTMKLAAKDGPLEKLGKHLKLFTELHEQQHTFTIMPELKLNGKTVIFNVGEPRKK